MTPVAKFNSHALVVREILGRNEPARAASYVREHLVEQRFIVGVGNATPTKGILLDVDPFQANDGRWHLSIYVMLDGTESFATLNCPNGKKCSFVGNFNSLSPIP